MRYRVFYAQCCLVLVIPLIACGGESVEGSTFAPATVEVVDGVATVLNRPVGRREATSRWDFRELWRVGGLSDAVAGGGVEFSTTLLSPVPGPNGQLYVLDFADDRIWVFTADSLVRSFGRTGRGPGELTNPTALAIDPDGKLWVDEPFQRRTSVLDSVGDFVKTVPLDMDGSFVGRRLQPMVFTDSGTVIREMGKYGEVTYMEFDTLGAYLSSSVTLKHPPFVTLLEHVPRSEDRRYLQRHKSALRWAVGPEFTLWFAYSEAYRLTQVDLWSGDTLRVIEASHRDDARLSRRDEGRIRELMGLPSERLENHGFFQPIIDALHVTADGHILGQIHDGQELVSSTFDIFDPEGQFLGTVNTDFNSASHGW